MSRKPDVIVSGVMSIDLYPELPNPHRTARNPMPPTVTRRMNALPDIGDVVRHALPKDPVAAIKAIVRALELPADSSTDTVRIAFEALLADGTENEALSGARLEQLGRYHGLSTREVTMLAAMKADRAHIERYAANRKAIAGKRI